MAALGPALRTPVRRALQAAIGLLPEGPPEEARRASRFLIVVSVHGADGSAGRGELRGTDVYGLTAVSTVHAASLLADPGYGRSGVLSVASAFEPVAFLNHLTDHGVSWEVAPA
jgi:hypothetical protein